MNEGGKGDSCVVDLSGLPARSHGTSFSHAFPSLIPPPDDETSSGYIYLINTMGSSRDDTRPR